MLCAALLKLFRMVISSHWMSPKGISKLFWRCNKQVFGCVHTTLWVRCYVCVQSAYQSKDSSCSTYCSVDLLNICGLPCECFSVRFFWLPADELNVSCRSVGDKTGTFVNISFYLFEHANTTIELVCSLYICCNDVAPLCPQRIYCIVKYVTLICNLNINYSLQCRVYCLNAVRDSSA